MVMIAACNLEALPKEPQFRIHMNDFPKSSLPDLHLFRGQKLEEISKFSNRKKNSGSNNFQMGFLNLALCVCSTFRGAWKWLPICMGAYEFMLPI